MQQINLYLPEFRQKKDWLSTANVAVVFGLFLLVLIVQYGVARYHQNVEEKRIVVLEQQHSALKESVKLLKRTPKPEKNLALVEETERLRKEIERRGEIAQLVSGRTLGNSEGFSPYLLAMGRHHVDGIALQAFQLKAGGAFARLEGMSRKAESIPFYLGKLQSDTPFQDVKFGNLTVRENNGRIEFLLSGNGPLAEETLQVIDEKTASVKR